MPRLRTRYNGPKSQPVKPIVATSDSPPRQLVTSQRDGKFVKPASDLPTSITARDLVSRRNVQSVLTTLLAECQADDAAAALIPWFCDALPSPRSRRDYFRDLRQFLSQMHKLGVHPYAVTGDHVRLYKEALVQAGRRPASIARALSVIRGAYEQFGQKGLVPWNHVGDIQAVPAPRVEKNTTPVIAEADAVKMLHAPKMDTVLGCRDHALLFTYFKTACRSSAVARAKVGDLERSDTDWFLRVREKGGRERRLPLLEAAPAILRWLDVVEIGGDATSPLFTALAPDRKTPALRHLSGQQILNIVKKYARQVGLNVNPAGRRGICTHSIRKTCAVNALKHGAQVHQVQHWLGHADVRTTQEYVSYKDEDIEEAARRCQIR
jgi:site-specific recombinase XerD